LARQLRRRTALSVTRPPDGISKVDYEPIPSLLVALRRSEVQDIVRVDVFLIEAVVVDGAVGFGVA
jgi:hypothetical protein